MSKDIAPARARVEEINNRAARVMAFTVDIQRDANGILISDQNELARAATDCALKDPMFENVDRRFVRQVATGWASAMIDYEKRNGTLPPADVLANAQRCTENLMLEAVADKHEGSGSAMFESVAADMRTSEGVMKLAQYVALILPVSLGAATSDACTFVPCERDKADIYELLNIAGTEFGTFKKGDELHMQQAGVYAQLKRFYIFPADQQPDGTEKAFAFKIADVEGKNMPIKALRTKLLINRRMSKVDDGDGNLYFNDNDSNGNAFAAACKVDYDKGIINVAFTDAPAAGTELTAQVEINIEKAPELIPVINQTMRSYSVSPSQYVIASEHTVMSASDASREFGLNMASIQFTAMRNWLSHEQDMMRLRIMAFHCVRNYQFDIALPEAQQYESWVGLIRHRLSEISTDMVNSTRKVGIRGGFAGGEAANFIKSLPPQYFAMDPDYVQTPHIQYIGTLFGTYRIYEVPKMVCDQFTKQGCNFGRDDILFYGRGEQIGEAGLISGDAVPAIPYVHETNPSLVNRTTLWGSSLNEMHPRNGENYFAKLKLTNSKAGAYDVQSGLKIGGPSTMSAAMSMPIPDGETAGAEGAQNEAGAEDTTASAKNSKTTK